MSAEGFRDHLTTDGSLLGEVERVWMVIDAA